MNRPPAILLLFFSVFLLTGFSLGKKHIPNTSAPAFNQSRVVFPDLGAVTAGWAPTQQFCNCADGSRYSYGNDCKTATGLCDQNPCPPAPPGCADD